MPLFQTHFAGKLGVVAYDVPGKKMKIYVLATKWRWSRVSTSTGVADAGFRKCGIFAIFDPLLPVPPGIFYGIFFDNLAH